ncbi:MAG: glycosyltransferase family 4 protein [Chloroflexi bacterium]|nr:glycosyltransferase family 4 protein [Chloroflexota bacterium]
MRIALAHSHANTFGGGERAVLELARGLSERGYDVRLLLGGFHPNRTYPELETLRVKRIGRLRWPLLRIHDDAIVTNTFGANLLSLRNGARVVYWAHTTRSVFLRSPSRRLDLRVRRALDWFAVRRAARLVANSRFTAGRLRSLYGRDADAVVYPGVDLDLFRPGESAATAYAITVGRLAPEKGLDRLVELWRELPDIPLHVVGDGRPELVHELRRMAPATVVFRGSMGAADLARAYREASVAVFAPYGEEFGIAPVEAMASGVPVVAWRDGGIQETILDSETGYLVNDAVTLRQRVRLLLHDPRRRAQFGLAARRRAEQFSWASTVTQMETVLRGLQLRASEA